LPRGLPPDALLRVVAHEMAHHIHSHYGVPCTVPEAEAFASLFEEAWVRAKRRGLSYPVSKCRCGFPLYPVGEVVRCPRCRASYRAYGYPQLDVAKAVGVGAMSALAAYFLAGWLERHPDVKASPRAISTLASGLVGFLAGLAL